jgi:ATP sulfurylase
MFDPVYYDPDHDSITDDIEYMKTKGEFVNISGSIIRRSILEGLNLSDKIIRGQFLNYCLEKYNNCSSSVFV